MRNSPPAACGDAEYRRRPTPPAGGLGILLQHPTLCSASLRPCGPAFGGFRPCCVGWRSTAVFTFCPRATPPGSPGLRVRAWAAPGNWGTAPVPRGAPPRWAGRPQNGRPFVSPGFARSPRPLLPPARPAPRRRVAADADRRRSRTAPVGYASCGAVATELMPGVQSAGGAARVLAALSSRVAAPAHNSGSPSGLAARGGVPPKPPHARPDTTGCRTWGPNFPTHSGLGDLSGRACPA